ncbi:hypothetical protein [Parachitinimonas caeni]|uniref:Uncharacterized protein n=1 Tax=Parachitinimonas caeni TaxID=3031301 RepID=A0ABT7E413_9NEIS|nr:hypothetical protein [Parachitinimonas caeni]MDK2125622.1 hypothetical protein [Parachitinimonas caeni]
MSANRQLASLPAPDLAFAKPLALYRGQVLAWDAAGVASVALADLLIPCVLAAGLARPPVDSSVLVAREGDSGVIIAAFPAPANGQRALQWDGETLSLSAQSRIELRCGDARMVLTADGRIELHGVNLLSDMREQQHFEAGRISFN